MSSRFWAGRSGSPGDSAGRPGSTAQQKVYLGVIALALRELVVSRAPELPSQSSEGSAVPHGAGGRTDAVVTGCVNGAAVGLHVSGVAVPSVQRHRAQRDRPGLVPGRRRRLGLLREASLVRHAVACLGDARGIRPLLIFPGVPVRRLYQRA